MFPSVFVFGWFLLHGSPFGSRATVLSGKAEIAVETRQIFFRETAWL
jgi:hypothetical protein